MIWVILYILVASGCVFGLVYWASKVRCWDVKYDFPWPVICGILWPIAGPLAAAYIATRWYIGNEKG